MNASQALRWALYYRALSLLSALIGFALVGAGVVLGLGDLLDVAMADDPAAEFSPIGLAAPLSLMILGVVVWQIGAAAAMYKTLTEAVDEQMADRFDSEQVKSEILTVLDDRLSDMHREVSETRRAVDDDATIGSSPFETDASRAGGKAQPDGDSAAGEAGSPETNSADGESTSGEPEQPH